MSVAKIWLMKIETIRALINGMKQYIRYDVDYSPDFKEEECGDGGFPFVLKFNEDMTLFEAKWIYDYFFWEVDEEAKIVLDRDSFPEAIRGTAAVDFAGHCARVSGIEYDEEDFERALKIK